MSHPVPTEEYCDSDERIPDLKDSETYDGLFEEITSVLEKSRKEYKKTHSFTSEDLKKGLEESQRIYHWRMQGYTGLWSATTRCIICGDWWMWGVENNLNFTCSKHKTN